VTEFESSGFSSFATALLSLARPTKRAIMITVDMVMLPLALWLALVLKFDRLSDLEMYSPLVVVAVISGISFLALLGLYRAVVRYMGPKAMAAVIAAVTLSVVCVGLYDRLWGIGHVPFSALAIYWAAALLYVGGSRLIIRYMFLYLAHDRTGSRVAIYGAGEAGARLSALLLGGADFQPVAFIDDKRTMQRNHINGITVFPPTALPQLIRERGIERILLAMPTASRRRRREILTSLEPLGIRVQSLPELSDIISGTARIDDLRDVEVNDLLGRDPVPPDPSLFTSCIRGKSVMVTGAGGSIGAELCRQILTLSPRRLVLFEMSELALYTIENELKQSAVKAGQSIEILPLLGNAHHRHRVREVMIACGVQTVYHAAAYKHVPIVEHNVIEGIHNNVISTWYTAEAALETNVETFVLISTDKAVNPANVMGATKRCAELVLQALQTRSNRTRFCMVRFGNVLDSSGSVVPLFRDQIRRGGPVTVTHPDVIRYFMTIPEAAQLVIQAGAMAKGGDVFVLDMGQPVRIDDLARRMINLMGLSVRDEQNPEGDIDIKYTGLRTGEKLYEELLIGNNVTGTDHPRILRAMEHSLPWDKVQYLLDDLLVALASFDCRRALGRLSDAVAEYATAATIEDYVWRRKAVSPSVTDAKVTVMHKRRLTDTSPRGQGEQPL
jgi:FlaA1/EpsC-like NDP-sugar epimerase